MNKLLLVVMLLMSGCSMRGNELICSPSGRLYSQMFGSGEYLEEHATDLRNTRQMCFNQPDGSIVIKNLDKIND